MEGSIFLQPVFFKNRGVPNILPSFSPGYHTLGTLNTSKFLIFSWSLNQISIFLNSLLFSQSPTLFIKEVSVYLHPVMESALVPSKHWYL